MTSGRWGAPRASASATINDSTADTIKVVDVPFHRPTKAAVEARQAEQDRMEKHGFWLKIAKRASSQIAGRKIDVRKT